MNNIREELEIRKNEIYNFILFEEMLEKNRIKKETLKQGNQIVLEELMTSSELMTIRTDIKASIVIMLYNVIEATMTYLLKRIHYVCA